MLRTLAQNDKGSFRNRRQALTWRSPPNSRASRSANDRRSEPQASQIRKISTISTRPASPAGGAPQPWRLGWCSAVHDAAPEVDRKQAAVRARDHRVLPGAVRHLLRAVSGKRAADFEETLDRARRGDLVYCDPPYSCTQSILYGAQSFSLPRLFAAIERCKARGARVVLSIDGTKRSGDTLCDVEAVGTAGRRASRPGRRCPPLGQLCPCSSSCPSTLTVVLFMRKVYYIGMIQSTRGIIQVGEQAVPAGVRGAGRERADQLYGPGKPDHEDEWLHPRTALF